jgi:hypothetical protein
MLFWIGLVVGGTLGMFITALCTISAIEEARHECMEMMRGDPDGRRMLERHLVDVTDQEPDCSWVGGGQDG